MGGVHRHRAACCREDTGAGGHCTLAGPCVRQFLPCCAEIPAVGERMVWLSAARAPCVYAAAVTLRAVLQSLQLVDMRNVSAPELVATVELPAGTTDVETCGDMAAASLENPDAAVLPGSVKIFTITAGVPWNTGQVMAAHVARVIWPIGHMGPDQ